MKAQLIAPPLAGNVVGSIGADFVIAEWKDVGGPPRAAALDRTASSSP